MNHFVQLCGISRRITLMYREDVAHATEHWAAVIHLSPATDTCLSPLEKEFTLWLFTPLTRGQFVAWSSYFPWLEVPYTSELYLVSVFLAVILSHNVFLAPGGRRGGVFCQLVKFSMGTNAAPACSNLIARAYKRATPLPPTAAVYRFLDDGCICYCLSLWLGACMDYGHIPPPFALGSDVYEFYWPVQFPRPVCYITFPAASWHIFQRNPQLCLCALEQ